MLSGCDDGAYALYRSSLSGRDMRIRVAAFDARVGEAYNRENCGHALALYGGQPGLRHPYGAKKGGIENDCLGSPVICTFLERGCLTAPSSPFCRGNSERKMASGTVKWFNSTKGFGFIQPDDGGTDVFVHISAVERAGMRELRDGQKISYEVVADRRSGKSSAENLKAE